MGWANSKVVNKSLLLLHLPHMWLMKIFISVMNYYRNWGTPWSYLQPTTEINGSFTAFHRKMDRRWWRAQVNIAHRHRFLMFVMHNLDGVSITFGLHSNVDSCEQSIMEFLGSLLPLVLSYSHRPS